jgi:hypothetical protein
VQHRERHPEGEQVGVGQEAAREHRMPVGPPTVAGARAGDDVRDRLAGQPDEEHGGRRRQRGPTACRPARGRPGEHDGQGGEHGKREVEGDLDHQRPRGSDAGQQGLRVVALEEQEALGQGGRLPGERANLQLGGIVAKQRHLQHHARQQQDHPVRGQNPEGAVAQVVGDPGSGQRAHHGGRERPVQQEAGEREEQDHADRQVRHEGRQWAEPWADPVGTAEEPAVVDQHAASGDRTKPFDARKP